MARNKIVMNSFYCINCGKKTLDLPRNRGFQHEKFHRKKLYCFNCKTEINHVECKNDEEVWDFKEDFLNGNFKEEALESLEVLSSQEVG